MDFLANENFPLTSIKMLRQAGYDIAAVIEEMPGAKDSQVLKRANEQKRIILTFDRDYGELIYRYNMAVSVGVVYLRFDPVGPEEPAQILIRILTEKKLSLTGKFTVVERDDIRQRNFPNAVT